jgi:adenine-specific DNA-methyltransferase
MAKKTQGKKTVATLTHEEVSRKNILTAEYEAVLLEKDKSAIRVAYVRQNRVLSARRNWNNRMIFHNTKAVITNAVC